MGKISSVLIVFMMVNTIGYILMASAIEDGFAVTNPYLGEGNLLTMLYSPTSGPDGQIIYAIGNNSEVYSSIPQSPPAYFLQQVGVFIDRIFVVFDFIRIMFAVLLFPVALITFMGLPWQLTQIFLVPLSLIYLIGFIDLISGGSN